MLEWDVFISHASEDKETVAEPLAVTLQTGGLKVWLDKLEIKLGDSLRAKIDDGLAKSRFGVVILSPAFLAKDWTIRELNGLSAIEGPDHKVLLPIWHNITKADLVKRSPMLADKLAISTDRGILAVAQEIIKVVVHPGSGSPSAIAPSLARRLSNLIESNAPPKEIFDFLSINSELASRLTGVQPKAYLVQDKVLDACNAFLCWFSTHGHIPGVIMLIGPVDSPLFDSNLVPCDALKKCIEDGEHIKEQVKKQKLAHIWSPVAEAEIRIFAGRRDRLSDDDIRGISEVRKRGIVIRSYGLVTEIASAFYG